MAGNLISASLLNTLAVRSVTPAILAPHRSCLTTCRARPSNCLSAGDASGAWSEERGLLWGYLSVQQPGIGSAAESEWSDVSDVKSPLVLHAPDGRKQESVLPILRWYESREHVHISSGRVFFFDDRASNVIGLRGTPYNAQQVMLCAVCCVFGIRAALTHFLRGSCGGASHVHSSHAHAHAQAHAHLHLHLHALSSAHQVSCDTRDGQI
eukprot:4920511-Prymnesium_polylepis.1